MPTKTYELISTTTTTSNLSAVTISSIPATYTDLVVVVNGSVVNGGGVGLAMRFNSDSGTNYEFMGHYSNGTSVSQNYAAGYTMNYCAIALSGSTLTTSVTHILNYATTGTFRPTLSHSGNSGFNSVYSGSWQNTLQAINSITFVCDGGSLITSGFKVSIYGILKA